jgi:hypothetical protein
VNADTPDPWREQVDAYAGQLAAAAPPLTEEQKATVVDLFLPALTARRPVPARRRTTRRRAA